MNINYVSIDEAINELRAGRPLIFSTDTVCGIGISVKHAKSPQCLYSLKNRPVEKPIAWLIGSADDLFYYGCEIPDYALNLAEEHWPGALTLIVKASSAVPFEYLNTKSNNKKNNAIYQTYNKTNSRTNANQTYISQDKKTQISNFSTIGMRCPKSDSVLQLIRRLGSPLCTTSANFSGESACTKLEDIDEKFLRDISVLKPELAQKSNSSNSNNSNDRNFQQSGLASSVIDCTGINPVILRKGNIII